MVWELIYLLYRIFLWQLFCPTTTTTTSDWMMLPPQNIFLWKPIPRQIHLSKFLCAGAAMRTFVGQNGIFIMKVLLGGCCWYNDNVISLIKFNLNRRIFLQNTQKSDPFPHASISSEIILLCHPKTKGDLI